MFSMSATNHLQWLKMESGHLHDLPRSREQTEMVNRLLHDYPGDSFKEPSVVFLLQAAVN